MGFRVRPQWFKGKTELEFGAVQFTQGGLIVPLKKLPDGIETLHPLLIVGGEDGLASLCEMVRTAWRNGEDFVIDMSDLVPSAKKCTIEFRRE